MSNSPVFHEINVDGVIYRRVSVVKVSGNVIEEHFFATDASKNCIVRDYTFTNNGCK